MPARPSIAIACCRNHPSADADDLYPDPESELLADALAELGLAAELVSWDDPDTEWSRHAGIVLRSTWDSVDRPTEFISWAHNVAKSSRLINSSDVIEWNLDKTYLAELANCGVPVVPTEWLSSGSQWQPPAGEYVIKPTISAGGRETARYGPPHEGIARNHVARLVQEGRTVMLQPHLPSVSDPGEISLVFIGNRFSHAVRKGPVLQAGEPAPPRPWERMTVLGLSEPTGIEKDVATGALQAIGRDLAYARVDLLHGPDGSPVVLEVELIDPNLSLTLFPPAATSLATVIASATLSGKSAPSPGRDARAP